MSKKYLKQSIITLLSLGLIFLANSVIWAWTAPTVAPPGGNVAAPINISGVAQYKAGDLAIGSGLNYWLTKYYDSFALKNNAGEIKFVLGQDGHIGIGTLAPAGLLEVAQTWYDYIKGSVIRRNGWINPRCPCDTDYSENCLSSFTSSVDLDAVCYDWVGGSMNANKPSYPYNRTIIAKTSLKVGDDGKLKLGSQTVDGDSADTVATKGYVDNKVGSGGCPTGFTWFTFGNTGKCLKEGAYARDSSFFLGGAWGFTGIVAARVNGGIIQTRARAESPAGSWHDSDWINGNTATICHQNGNETVRVIAKTFADGIKTFADIYWQAAVSPCNNNLTPEKGRIWYEDWLPWEFPDERTYPF